MKEKEKILENKPPGEYRGKSCADEKFFTPKKNESFEAVRSESFEECVWTLISNVFYFYCIKCFVFPGLDSRLAFSVLNLWDCHLLFWISLVE